MADLVDVIRFPEGKNDQLVWKSPIEDFNSGTTVIVDESQVAVFYMNGQCSEELQPGRHVLETCQLPFIKKVFENITKGKTPFSAQLYYINKIEFAKLKWGKGGIQYNDVQGASFDIGVRGLYNIQVVNPRKLIEKINGVEANCDKYAIEDRFRELVASAVDNSFINIMEENNISILKVSSHRVEIAKKVLPEIEELFLEYGIKVTQFIIEHVTLPEDNKYLKELRSLAHEEANQIRRLQLKGQAEIANSEIAAKNMDILSSAEVRKRQREGYTYHDERQFDVMQDAVNNPDGSGNFMGQFTQLGVGLGAAGTIGNFAKDMFSGLQPQNFASPSTQATTVNVSNPVNQTNPGDTLSGNAQAQTEMIKCSNCSAVLMANAKFCPECGQKVIPAGKIICPNCKQIVSKGKFCLECGFKLEETKPVCKSCGFVLEQPSKFCPECGQPT